MEKPFLISQYHFDTQLEQEVLQNHRDFVSWPIVYFLNDEKLHDAYVGETTDVLNRMKAHSKNLNKQKLSTVHLIFSRLFNKSATLDLESYLIRYVSADGQYKLQNGNLGISNHQYYQQKEVYWEVFKDIWDELRQLGIARHSLEHIDNSDLFKYSPYKSLSREQINGLKTIFTCLLDDSANVSLIHGGAGTGKSILAIFLFKLLKTNLDDFNFADFEEEDEELFHLLEKVKAKYGEMNIALVIPMASFRKTISNVFKNIKGLSPKMVIGPSEVAKQKYDLLIVDEGHRLRRRVNLGSYFGTFDINSQLLGLDKEKSSELDWVVMQSSKTIIFYDELQSIKPSDTLKEDFITLQEQPFTRIEKLRTQFRVQGGNKYVSLIHDIFSENEKTYEVFPSVGYDFQLFDNLEMMVNEIKKKEKKEGLSRMVAGFAWEWISNKNKEAYDIVIGDCKLKWNSTAIDWVNSANAINEVGCIHTTQGYDLNYTGVIIGHELDYDFENKCFVVYKERYKDKNGKNSIADIEVLKEYILNIYKTIFLRGIKGTYVYACNENLRKYLAQSIPQKMSIFEKPTAKIVDFANEMTIPYYDLEIAAGGFSDLQHLETTRFIEMESTLQNQDDYFACKVVGESMNKIIPNGSICLFKKHSGGSRNGLITLVQLNNYNDIDFGSSYTVKEYSSKKTVTEEGWNHEEIVLLPKSTFEYKPIVLRDDDLDELTVVGTFVKVLITGDGNYN